MFKSKINFDEFDTNNEKVKNLEYAKVKNLSKASVKKLLAKPEGRAPFYMIVDYFKDEQDKPLGNLLCFGINKKLTKHFEQVEMKSGKLDKRMSANQKEASMGEAYAKEENDKYIIYFEPSTASKVPGGKWPKILKALKPFLAGKKALVSIGGQIIGGEEETGGAPTEASVEGETPEETTQDNTTDTAQDTTTDTTTLAAAFKAQLEEISAYLKQTLPKEILPKIKDRSVEAADLDLVQEIKDKMTAFETSYQEAAETIQSKLTKMRDSIAQQAPKVDQIFQAVERLLGGAASSDASPETAEEDSLIDELLARAKEGLEQFNSVYGQLKTDLEQSEEEPIEGGDALLETIGR